ncbi:IS256 family transposase [Microbacterium sp. 2C]|uniref:IS256 family transposase n=1 Tax=Microbacterium paulum TaxID=2707006 RepID=UPI0018C2D0F5|nr:IS256 family transposase [Microbacterium paulum]MBG0717689.1 IS256 family transposase [Microbacterium paulum]
MSQTIEMIDPVTGEIIGQQQIAEQLLAQAKEQGVGLVGPGGLLGGLTKTVLETALEAEMTEHLGYEKHASSNGENARKRTRSKTVLTEVGAVEIDVPRDRDGSFQPKIVRKRQRRLDGIDEIVLSLTARGLRNKPFYVAVGVTTAGERDILGIWAGDGGEGAKFWLGVLTEIKNRGVEDVCIVVCDGLKGLPESITTTWELAVVQTCIIHLIRNTFRFASRKYWDQIARDLRPVYTAPTEAAAKARFEEFAEKWCTMYPAIRKLWENAWTEFIPFLDYDVEIRRIICSTNAIESLNARYRRAVRARGHFPNDAAALKCLYLVTRSLDPTGRGRARWVTRWKPALNAFAITFEGRIN